MQYLGIFFIFLGCAFVALGGICGWYGRYLIYNPIIATLPIEVDTEPLRLLNRLNTVQTKYGVHKLIISKDGNVYKNTKDMAVEMNIIKDFFQVGNVDPQLVESFEKLVFAIPSIYLRNIPESRMGSPYILSVTPEGKAYLRTHK